jgi:superfamily II DNA or RNA helicase
MATINTPDEWVKENRAGFYKWIYTTFHEDMNKSPKESKGKGPSAQNANNRRTSSRGSCDCSSGSETEDGSCTAPTDISMLPHQRFVRDYIQYDSPYRGILLYHGLGTGKSFSSIAAAEGFLGRHSKIVVMIPASLATNYRQEITRFGSLGKPETKKWSLVNFKGNEHYADEIGLTAKFLKKHNNLLWIPNVPGSFPTNIILKGKGKKTTPLGVSWNDMTAEDHVTALDLISFIIDERYTFVNYNGLSKQNITQYTEKFFENAFVIIDEAHNFISRVVNGGKYGRRIYENLMNAAGVRLVLLSGTPIINHPFELSFMLNLIRGPMKVYEFQFLKGSRIPTKDDLEGVLYSREDHIGKYIDQLNIIEGKNILQVSLLPKGFINSNDNESTNIHIKKDDWLHSEKEVIDQIGTLLKLREKDVGYRIGKRVATIEKFALPERKEDFNELFLDETDPENPKVKNMDLFMRRNIGVISYFRTAGEEYFPKVLPKIIEQIPLCNYQFSRYVKVRDEERQMESRKKRNNARAGAGGILAGKGTVYRAFSRMACNFVFPEDIKRPFPKDLRRALQREIDSMEDDTADESEETDNVNDAKTEKKTKVNEADVQKKYEEAMKKAMSTVEAKAQNILTSEKLETLYSAKLAKLLEHVNTSPGKVLVYSQFRTIEGLGILKLILETAGYVEIKLENKSGALMISDAEKVLAPIYNGKRFIIFDPDREKTRVLLHLYNGEFDKLSKELQEQLNIAKITNNLRGDAFKAIMITQSGAEGISLKNVRRVMIMEPFWNMVRMDQVIGRAVRTCSHVELPVAERNVEVYIYTSVFTEKQLKDNFTLRRLDLGLTSDAHILQIAEKKDVIIQTFLNHLKSCAVDCRVHAAVNKPREHGFSCYAFPIPTTPDTYSFIPDITYDKPHVLERRKKIQGKVVLIHGKKYVVVEQYPEQLFDYAAYKNAGVLEEVDI